MKKTLLVLLMGIFLVSFTSAVISYNENFVREDKMVATGWVTTFRDNGTNVAYSSGYTANFDYFDDDASINDTVYIGGLYQQFFTGFKTTRLNPIVSDSHTLVWEYYNGSWVELENVTALSGSTINLTSTGEVGWNKPTDWKTTTIGGKNYFWFRIRLTNYDNLTEGGKQTTDYFYLRPAIIYIGTGESVTPASLKTLSDTNGWNTVNYVNGVYLFRDGLYTEGGVTFTATNTDIQIGTPDKYGICGFTSTDTLLFNQKSGNYLSGRYVNFLNIYCAPDGCAFFYSDSNSEFNNMMIDNKVNRMLLKSDGIFYNCNFEYMLPYLSPKFERTNINYIGYLLTTPDAIYKNTYLRNAFRVDPRYMPVIEDSIFDSDGDFLTRHFPNDKLRHHFFKAIDCKWVQDNKFNIDTGDYPLTTYKEQNLRHVYSHKFNLKIIDENGNGISNVNITLKDKYGNSQIFEVVKGSYTTTNYLMEDTTITVNDGTNFTVDKYYKTAEEIVKVTNIAGNVLTVDRGLWNTTSYVGVGTNEIKWYESKNSILTNVSGEINELDVIEWAIFRYGDGTDSYINNYTYYPYTMTISAENYEDYSITFNLTEKLDWTIALESRDWNYSQSLAWKILNKTDTTILKLSDDGNLAIAGNLYENTNSPPPSANIVWKFLNFMWLDDMGNLYIKGVAYLLNLL